MLPRSRTPSRTAGRAMLPCLRVSLHRSSGCLLSGRIRPLKRMPLVRLDEPMPVDTERPQIVIPRPAFGACEVHRVAATGSFDEFCAATHRAAEVRVGLGDEIRQDTHQLFNVLGCSDRSAPFLPVCLQLICCASPIAVSNVRAGLHCRQVSAVDTAAPFTFFPRLRFGRFFRSSACSSADRTPGGIRSLPDCISSRPSITVSSSSRRSRRSRSNSSITIMSSSRGTLHYHFTVVGGSWWCVVRVVTILVTVPDGTLQLYRLTGVTLHIDMPDDQAHAHIPDW